MKAATSCERGFQKPERNRARSILDLPVGWVMISSRCPKVHPDPRILNYRYESPLAKPSLRFDVVIFVVPMHPDVVIANARRDGFVGTVGNGANDTCCDGIDDVCS